MARHAMVPHTGELELRIEAANIEELFAEAARALAGVLGTAHGAPGPEQAIELVARDREALLVAWLDELIGRADIEHRLYPEVTIDEVTPQRLRARIRGIPIGEARTAVKAATFHNLRIASGPGGVEVHVILDV